MVLQVYNDKTIWGNSYTNVQEESQSDDPFNIAMDRSIPQLSAQPKFPPILRNSPDAIMSANIEPLRKVLQKDLEQDPPSDSGWKQLMEYDTCSTRPFLGTELKVQTE
ncbi:hypothetical protein QQZ08_000964 [Neonectria magnoliae]|uniref:Uncharacterized protein n=1 Tax=Neonectria magnoliae TaxID=2732573 RepID=A0ABR1IFI5_9HYPO